MKDAIIAAATRLATAVTSTMNGHDAVQYAQAVSNLMQALVMLHNMERGQAFEPVVDEVVPEGGTD